MDERNKKLAYNLVNYSCKVEAGEKVLIELRGFDGLPLLNCIVKEVYKAGGLPFVLTYNETTERELLLNATEEQLKINAELDVARMSQMDAYIGIRATSNITENSDVPEDRMELYQRIYSMPVHTKTRVPKTKWVVLRYPNASMSQLAGKSQEAFEEFYYNVSNLDYAKMDKAMDSLKALMEKTDRVRIIGAGTDISFSIKSIPVVKCAGICNIPDGEIYTAPVRDSVNGRITYNTPSNYQGFVYENVSFEFENGKIVNATANNNQRVNKVLDTDDSARYIGEFAIGVNPYILEPMKDTLFDEKIMGSFHFTPGASYDNAYNGNKSAIHWDLICIQTEEYGGGEMYFDDILIRKNGRFVLSELDCLNPENLK